MPMPRWPLVATLLALAACAAPLQPAEDRSTLYRIQAIGPLIATSVAVDSQLSTHPKERLVDGNLSTQWTNGGYRNSTAWARLGFASSASIANVQIKTGTSPAGTRYDVQTSADGVSWTTRLANLTNTSWNLETKTLPAGTTGKFVRIFWRNSATNPQPHFSIYELKVNGGTSASPTPTTSPRPTTSPSASPSSGTLICPSATPAPGGGTTCYPEGTVFVTGNVRITVGPGGVFTPNHVYIRPGATTTIVNIDTAPHTFTGFNGATYDSGPIAPGASITKSWIHPGTWYFHDRLTTNPPTFALTDVPY